MKVLFAPEVRAYFRELAEILFDKEYFGFEESAVRYVRELIFEIRDNLPVSMKYPAPSYFSRFGSDLYYASFRRNKSTQWYAFFQLYEENGELIYLVKYITNNHVSAQYF